ncbi:MAG: hypothetical protein WAV47_25655 [Blastocatellia bacterium]
MSQPKAELRIVRDGFIPLGKAHLEGGVEYSSGASGIVLLAHGSGSRRHSPRNKYVVRTLLLSLYRGGRPDFAGASLPKVEAPKL